MFDKTISAAAKQRGRVEMKTTLGGQTLSGFRPKSKIVGKANIRGYTSALFPLDEETFLLGYDGKYVSSPCGIQIRDRQTFDVLRELAGPKPRFQLRADRRMLLATEGPRGVDVNTMVVDVANLKVVDHLPLMPPFCWLSADEDRFLAFTPIELADSTFGTDPHLLEGHDYLLPELETPHTLACVVLASESIQLLKYRDRYCYDSRIACAPDFRTLSLYKDNGIRAIDAAAAKPLWNLDLLQTSSLDFSSMYELSCSPDGRWLAVSYLGRPHDFLIVDASTGEIAHTMCTGNPAVVVWHPSGWAAVGTNQGTVLFVHPEDGSVRTFRGSQRSIRSMMFLDDALLIGGAEKQLRVWPLLEDEC